MIDTWRQDEVETYGKCQPFFGTGKLFGHKFHWMESFIDNDMAETPGILSFHRKKHIWPIDGWVLKATQTRSVTT